MSLTTIVKKKMITDLFVSGVKLINQMVNLDEWKNEFFPDEDRTLAINIQDLEDLPTGFVFEDGQIRAIDKLNDVPTLTMHCDENTFLAIATQRYTMQQAFWYGWIKLKGTNYLRDFKIFQVMFDRYPEVLEAINPLL